MKYRLTPEAEQDLRGIWAYTQGIWGRQKANDYLQQMQAAFGRLCEHVDLGKKRDEVRVGYRSFPQGQHVIFYRISGQQLEIVKVLHRRMDVEKQFGTE